MSADKGCQPWFDKDPDLFKVQAGFLEAAGFELDKDTLKQHGCIRFVGHSKVDPQRQLIVLFPQAFPSCAPKFFDTPTSKLLSRHHRSDTRQLCLFGFNENRWNATLSVEAALAEAEELISKFRDGNSALGDQPPEPLTRAIQHVPGSAFLVPPPISTFENFAQLKSPSGRFTGKFIHEGVSKHETRGRGIICDAMFGDKKFQSSHPFGDYLDGKGSEIHGEWFYLQSPPTQQSLPGVLNKCFEHCRALKKTEYYWIGLIFNEETAGNGQTRITWLIARAHLHSPGKFHLIRTFPYIQQERFVRIPGLEGLESKRIILVGCGSLGSKIAANLAASGLNRFHLVDYDYFEPNNAVRHELGVECFGLNKEKALLTRLRSLNPAVADNSTSFNFQVGAANPFTAEQQFFNLIKESDLIVDTAGVHSVSHFINELSYELRVPALFATVTNGAWSGEIVRTLPGKTACWVCWLDQYFDIKPPSAPSAEAEIFAPGCDQPTFTGTTYDLGIVASLAASMAVETLLPDSKHTDFSKNYIRWSGKDKDGKPVFLTETHSTAPQKGCWLCDS